MAGITGAVSVSDAADTLSSGASSAISCVSATTDSDDTVSADGSGPVIGVSGGGGGFRPRLQPKTALAHIQDDDDTVRALGRLVIAAAFHAQDEVDTTAGPVTWVTLSEEEEVALLLILMAA